MYDNYLMSCKGKSCQNNYPVAENVRNQTATSQISKRLDEIDDQADKDDDQTLHPV